MKYSLKHIRALRAYAFDHGFSLPVNADEATDEMLQNVYNGIGAEWMPKFLRKFITWLLANLEATSMYHDWEFEFGNTFWDFIKANLRFMYNAAKSRQLIAGIAFGTICTVFGWSAFKVGKREKAEGA